MLEKVLKNNKYDNDKYLTIAAITYYVYFKGMTCKKKTILNPKKHIHLCDITTL